MNLALIAGRGSLPRAVADTQKTLPLVCALENNPPDELRVDVTFQLETLGSLLVTLGARGVTDICLVGSIERPDFQPEKLDAETAPLAPLFVDALAKGDDGALTIIIELFEKTGFAVRGAHELAPHLLAAPGVHSDHWPTARTRLDAQAGADHIAAIGPSDIGQACIVTNGRVVAMEDAGGTDALIARCGPFPASDEAVLFKGPKPQQSRIVDLPTIGPDTLRAASAAGLAAVVIDADDVLVLDHHVCVEVANAHDLVFWARTGE